MTKKFCQVHHLYYSSNECPLCLSERSGAMANKFCKEPVKQEEERHKEITQDSLEALKAKFNNHQ